MQVAIFSARACCQERGHVFTCWQMSVLYLRFQTIAVRLLLAILVSLCFSVPANAKRILTLPDDPASTVAMDLTAGDDMWQEPAAPGHGWDARVTPGGVQPMRLLAWNAFSAGVGYVAFRESQSAWGPSRGKFHFKSDFKGDGMAMSDETSHLFAAYHLTQLVEAGYRWTGMDHRRARRLAALEAWLWTFAVEYPIDAYNPGQGFGVSDLMFNTIGVAGAYWRSGRRDPRWDVKIGVKRQFFNGSARLIAYTGKQYDDYIYWLTFRPVQQRYVPILLGIGYSTTHGSGRTITKEMHFGLGTSLEEIGGMIGERTRKVLAPLNFFFLNVGTKIPWR